MEPEAEPFGPQAELASRLGPVRQDGRNRPRFEGYMEHPCLQFEDDEKIRERCVRHGVSVLEDGGVRLLPTWNLEDACLPRWILPRLAEVTPLQAVTWPVLRSNRDLVAMVEHGCGKTLAYAVPLLVRAAALQGARHERPEWWREMAWQTWRQRPPDAVILVPSLEVSTQVQEEIADLAKTGRVLVAGGTDGIALEKELSRAGILVLTPWQLQCQSWALGKDEDLVALNQDVMIIFDGAEHIIQDGEDEGAQARTVLDFMPKSRVLAFFSTVWPRSTDEMVRRHLRQPVVVYATEECESNAERGLCLNSCFVVQRFQVMHCLTKQQKLLEAVKAVQKREGGASVIIFCNQPATVEGVAQYLEEKLTPNVCRVHEAKNTETCNDAILVATTMMGRYAFPKVQWLINYDMPGNLLEYLCRMRWASRGDSPGYALTFLVKEDLLQAKALRQLLRMLQQDCPDEIQRAAESSMPLELRFNPEFLRRPRSFGSDRDGQNAWRDSRRPKETTGTAIPAADWKDWKPRSGGTFLPVSAPRGDRKPGVMNVRLSSSPE